MVVPPTASLLESPVSLSDSFSRKGILKSGSAEKSLDDRRVTFTGVSSDTPTFGIKRKKLKPLRSSKNQPELMAPKPSVMRSLLLTSEC